MFFLCIFLYVYQTPVIPKIVYPILELIALSFFVILRSSRYWLIFSKFKVENTLIAAIVLLSLVRDAVTGEITYSDRFLVWWFQAYLFGVVIVYFLIRYRSADMEEFPRMVYLTGIVAACISVTLYFFPFIDNFYKSIQLDSYYETYANFDERYRAYGFSENLTFTYGYILGIFAGYAFLGIKKNIFSVFPMMFLVLGMALNARIGFLPFILIIIYGSVYNNKIGSNFRLLVSLLSVFLFIYYFREYISSRAGWVISFFEEFTSLLSSDKNSAQHGTIDVIFGDFIVWPNNSSEWFFGSGRSLFLDDHRNTDLGIFLQLNYAGVFFLILIFLFSGYTSWRIFSVFKRRHWFPYIYTFSIFFLNFKGFLFAATPGGRLLFVLYMYYVTINSRTISMKLDKRKITKNGHAFVRTKQMPS